MSTILAPLFSELWQVQTGVPFSASLVANGNMADPGFPVFGARVERPVTGAIVSPFMPATLSGDLFTVTLDGPLDEGAYQLAWMTVDDPPTYRVLVPLFAASEIDITAAPVVEFPPLDENGVTPSVDDVAALLRTRTVGANGVDTGLFSDQTRPTSVEVAALINQSAGFVLAMMRPAIDPVHYTQITHLIALYTAMLVEASYYREQEGQRADFYQQQFTQSLTALQARVDQDLVQANLLGGMEPWHPEHRLERWQLL